MVKMMTRSEAGGSRIAGSIFLRSQRQDKTCLLCLEPNDKDEENKDQHPNRNHRALQKHFQSCTDQNNRGKGTNRYF